MFFMRFLRDDKNKLLRQKISIKFKEKINLSIENKITFDFYSMWGKHTNGFDNTNINKKTQQWYENQIDYLSKYVSKYFDNMLF